MQRVLSPGGKKKHVTLIKDLQTTHNHSGSWTTLRVLGGDGSVTLHYIAHSFPAGLRPHPWEKSQLREAQEAGL